jgi:tetratricopeptide (TPR) repeat protein
MSLAFTLSACGPEPLTDCDKGLCGQKWAMELDTAVAKCEVRVKTQPNDVNALLGLADAYIQKAFFIQNQTNSRADFWLSSNLKKIELLVDQALNQCDKVLRQKDVARAYQLKAKSLLLRMQLSRRWTLDEYPKMVANLEKALSLSPNSADIWYDLGEAYRYYYFERDKAKRCFEKAVEIDPEHVRAYVALLEYSRSMARDAKFFSDAARVMAANRTSPDPQVLRSLMDASIGFDPESYLESIRIIPNLSKLPLLIGAVLFARDDRERRSALLDRIVHDNHHFPKDHLDLAYSYQYQLFAKTDKALKQFWIWAQATNGLSSRFLFGWWRKTIRDKLTKAYPMSPWVWINAGRASPALAGITELKRAIELDSNQALPYYFIATTFVEKDDWLNAEQWLRVAKRKASGDEFITLNAHILTALISARTGDMSRMFRETELALKMDSTYVADAMAEGIYGRIPVRFLLDKPIALESLRAPSERKLASLLNLWSGWSHYYRGSSDGTVQQSVPFFRKAIELDPENPQAYIAIASLYSSFLLRDAGGTVFVQNALRRFPGSAKLREQLGSLYINNNMLDKAQREFEKAFQQGDYSAKGWLILLQEWKAEQQKQ